MTTRINPTFLLKGIDPVKLYAEYQAGYFNRPVPVRSKITIVQNNTILAPVYGTTNHDPIFTVKDRNNCSIIIATTGHSDFEVFTRTGGSLPLGGRCGHCREDFTGIAMGYPIGYSETTVLTNVEGKVPNYQLLYSFWVEGKFCSFECALGYIQLILSKPADFRDTTIRDSGRLLKILYKRMYPNSEVLRPAQDPNLLGTLTKQEWQDHRHVYVRTDRVLMIPAKVEYIRQNFLSPVMTIDYARDSIPA